MEITLGDTIKVNGEEVPEYLLKAIYEKLHLIYARTTLSDKPMIITLSDDKTKVISLQQDTKTIYYRENQAWAIDKGLSGFPNEVIVRNIPKISVGAINYPWDK